MLRHDVRGAARAHEVRRPDRVDTVDVPGGVGGLLLAERRERRIGLTLPDLVGVPRRLAVADEQQPGHTVAPSRAHPVSTRRNPSANAPGAKPAETGLDKPSAHIVAATFDGLTYTVKLGKASGENFFATMTVAGTGKASGADAAERQKKIDERLPRERALAAHTVLIAKSKFEDILKKRGELLEKKEGKKK